MGLRAVILYIRLLLLVGLGVHGVSVLVGRVEYRAGKGLELALFLHFFHLPAS